LKKLTTANTITTTLAAASTLFFMPRGNNYSFRHGFEAVHINRLSAKTVGISYGQKTRPGRCPEQELIAQRTLMINQAREVFLPGEILGILNIRYAHCEPMARCPVDFYAASLS
jgi:hypothetical protein